MSRLGDSLRVGGSSLRSSDSHMDDEHDDDSSNLSSDAEGGDSRPLVGDRTHLISHIKQQIKDKNGGAGVSQNKSLSNDTSRRLGETASSIHDVDASLDRTTRALASTELFGSLTSAQLVAQRESFQRQRAQLSATDEYLNRSKNLLQRMQYRLVTDKLVQGIIILVELFAIGAIIYFKYYR